MNIKVATKLLQYSLERLLTQLLGLTDSNIKPSQSKIVFHSVSIGTLSITYTYIYIYILSISTNIKLM